MLVQTDDEVRAMVQALATHEVSIGADTVPVIFDASYRSEMNMDATTPAATLAAADWPDVVQGDAVTIGSTGYAVTRVEPDGDGMLTVRLQRAA